jgi:hypothetical protein
LSLIWLLDSLRPLLAASLQRTLCTALQLHVSVVWLLELLQQLLAASLQRTLQECCHCAPQLLVQLQPVVDYQHSVEAATSSVNLQPINKNTVF